MHVYSWSYRLIATIINGVICFDAVQLKHNLFFSLLLQMEKVNGKCLWSWSIKPGICELCDIVEENTWFWINL